MNIEKALDIDSSKLSDYMRCPRYFFYRHVAGWSSSSPNLDLEFGTAWHKAMEYVLLHKGDDSKRVVTNAMLLFDDYFRRSFSEDTDLTTFPKNPGNAELALLQYIKQYSTENREFNVVEINGKPATEIFGSVPIGPSRKINFRLDAICKNQYGKFFFVDHKTSKQDAVAYQNQFHLAIQMLDYYHVVNCIYGQQAVADCGGVVNLAILRKDTPKGGNKHIRIPIAKSVEMMNEWLWMVNKWFDDIEQDCGRLSRMSLTEDRQIMQAFVKRDAACASYGRTCTFYDFCLAWANPLSHIDQPPEGMKEEYWSPFNKMEENNLLLNL